jgi:hypothetical protein
MITRITHSSTPTKSWDGKDFILHCPICGVSVKCKDFQEFMNPDTPFVSQHVHDFSGKTPKKEVTA